MKTGLIAIALLLVLAIPAFAATTHAGLFAFLDASETVLVVRDAVPHVQRQRRCVLPAPERSRAQTAGRHPGLR